MTKNVPYIIPCLLIFFCIFFGLLAAPCNADDYSVGPGDVLKIDVYDHDDLTTTVRVTDQGFVVMPLLGRVQVGGMSLFDVTDKLTRQLADGYIVNPQVNLFVEEFGSKKAVILGHVNQPGLIKLRGPTTFLELISYAGGFKEGSGDAASIKRKDADKKDVILISIKALVEEGDLSQNVMIHDGDTIYIAKGGMCYVTGEVGAPDAYPCDKQTTILKLIALAGGFTAKASQSSVRIVRLVDGEKTVTKNVDLGTSVMANDIIVIPESFF